MKIWSPAAEAPDGDIKIQDFKSMSRAKNESQIWVLSYKIEPPVDLWKYSTIFLTFLSKSFKAAISTASLILLGPSKADAKAVDRMWLVHQPQGESSNASQHRFTSGPASVTEFDVKS